MVVAAWHRTIDQNKSCLIKRCICMMIKNALLTSPKTRTINQTNGCCFPYSFNKSLSIDKIFHLTVWFLSVIKIKSCGAALELGVICRLIYLIWITIIRISVQFGEKLKSALYYSCTLSYLSHSKKKNLVIRYLNNLKIHVIQPIFIRLWIKFASHYSATNRPISELLQTK